jgi:cytochrome oxidase Cu insertion factor (SCO1/SenC/PrrC family)
MRVRLGWRALVVPAVVAAVAAAGVIGGLLWASGQRPGGQSRGYPAGLARPGSAAGYGPAPSFTLTDQSGQAISSAHFRGKVQVVSFLFPYCTTDCPPLARDLALLQRSLAAQGLGGTVEIVTFNVDPGGAGPRQLAAFLDQYGAAADPAATPHWHFLTGSPRQVKHVVRDHYHVAYWKVAGADEGAGHSNALAERAHAGYDIKHSEVTDVVDGTGSSGICSPARTRPPRRRCSTPSAGFTAGNNRGAAAAQIGCSAWHCPAVPPTLRDRPSARAGRAAVLQRAGWKGPAVAGLSALRRASPRPGGSRASG